MEGERERSDRGETYRERGESRAWAQHDVLVRSLEKVAEEAEGEKMMILLLLFLQKQSLAFAVYLFGITWDGK